MIINFPMTKNLLSMFYTLHIPVNLNLERQVVRLGDTYVSLFMQLDDSSVSGTTVDNLINLRGRTVQSILLFWIPSTLLDLLDGGLLNFSSCNTIFVLIEYDITFLLNEQTLGEGSVERVERWLSSKA
jgi:hypothetical protein